MILFLSGSRTLISDLHGISKRPAIVLYDSGDQDVLLARITTQEYTTETDYKIPDWQKGGLLTESYIRLGKQATIEKQFIYEPKWGRQWSRLYTTYKTDQIELDDRILNDVLNYLKVLVSVSKPLLDKINWGRIRKIDEM